MSESAGWCVLLDALDPKLGQVADLPSNTVENLCMVGDQ